MPVRTVVALHLAFSAAAWSLALWLALERWDALDARPIAGVVVDALVERVLGIAPTF